MLHQPLKQPWGHRHPKLGSSCPKRRLERLGASPWPYSLMEFFIEHPKMDFFQKKKKRDAELQAPFWVSTGGGSAPLSLSPQGPVTMEESTQGVLRVLAGLSASSNGTFWDWRGQSLPW